MRVCYLEILFMDGSCGDILAEENYEETLLDYNNIDNHNNIDLISEEMVIELEDLNNYIEMIKS